MSIASDGALYDEKSVGYRQQGRADNSVEAATALQDERRWTRRGCGVADDRADATRSLRGALDGGREWGRERVRRSVRPWTRDAERLQDQRSSFKRLRTGAVSTNESRRCDSGPNAGLDRGAAECSGVDARLAG